MTLKDLLSKISAQEVNRARHEAFPDDLTTDGEYEELYQALASQKPTFDFADQRISVSHLRSGELAAGNIFQGALSDLLLHPVDNKAGVDDATLLAAVLHGIIKGRDNGTFNYKHNLD